jgi:trans-aconitate 2-methyltransferase
LGRRPWSASVKAIVASIGDGWLGPAHYETVEATRDRLLAAGFVDVEAWLQPEPTRFEPGEPFETFLRTVILGPQVDRLPEDARAAYVREVAARLGEPVVDYVRLNVDARRRA